jgi:hypothetical protein
MVDASVAPDPLFGDIVEARFQELRSQIAGDVRLLPASSEPSQN